MVTSSLILAVLTAVAAVFAALFFQNRKDVRKYETKSESLSRELSDMKCEFARRESICGDALVHLTRENIADFLKREKTCEVEVSDELNVVSFVVNGRHCSIDCSRLPQQFILRTGYGGMEGKDIHWDILEQASVKTTKDLVMVKLHVTPNVGFGFMIVSTTHTIAALREDYDFFMSLIDDADRNIHEEYRKIMENEHPEECAAVQQEPVIDDIEDYARKIAAITPDQKKMQS